MTVVVASRWVQSFIVVTKFIVACLCTVIRQKYGLLPFGTLISTCDNGRLIEKVCWLPRSDGGFRPPMGTDTKQSGLLTPYGRRLAGKCLNGKYFMFC